MEKFLWDIDCDLLRHAGELRKKGFTSTLSAWYLVEEDLHLLSKTGHKRPVLNMIARLKTPERVKSEERQTQQLQNTELNLKSPALKKVSRSGSNGDADEYRVPKTSRNVSLPISRRQLLSACGRFIEEKRQALKFKLKEASSKREELEETSSKVRCAQQLPRLVMNEEITQFSRTGRMTKC